MKLWFYYPFNTTCDTLWKRLEAWTSCCLSASNHYCQSTALFKISDAAQLCLYEMCNKFKSMHFKKKNYLLPIHHMASTERWTNSLTSILRLILESHVTLTCMYFLWVPRESQCTRRTCNSTQKGLNRPTDSNPEPSCCTYLLSVLSVYFISVHMCRVIF